MRPPPNAISVPLPVQFIPWVVAFIHADRDQLQSLWGTPHYVERDPWATASGEEDCWAWKLPSGQQLMVILSVPAKVAYIHCDPPDLDPILIALDINPVTQKLEILPPNTLPIGYNRPPARP